MPDKKLINISKGYEHPPLTSYPSFSLSLYGELIKSKQTFLLSYTAVFAYFISSWTNGLQFWNFIWFVISIFFAISGSTLLNMYIDRDIDALMERTKDRPIPSGRIPPSTVRKHGALFTSAGILAAGIFVNFMTMIVIFLGFFFDVIVYSLLLKRRTRYSIVFGGVAGGLPAIAGRTAVLGVIDLSALLMALFVLCWIPLHILTLALISKNLNGYRIARVPMWPVVSSEKQTIRVISISALLSALCILLSGLSLQIYIVALIPLAIFSAFMIFLSIANLKNPCSKRTFRIFKLASIYMAFAFLWLFVGIIFTSFLA